MWAEVKKVKDEERVKREAKLRAEGRMDDEEILSPDEVGYKEKMAKRNAATSPKLTPATAPTVASSVVTTKKNSAAWMAAIAAFAIILAFLLFRKKTPRVERNPK